MNKVSLSFLLIFIPFTILSQSGQLSIPRIDLMPDLPSPLHIRNWEKVARDYDALIFDLSGTGQYLPLSRLGTPGQFNYADNTPLFLDSYVGADSHGNQAEAINIMPAIVGASLAGIDKSNQSGKNWVAMTKDFFNLKNGQNVYLNGYSTTSGHDWWYDLMPNIYFYQLKSIYPDAAPEFDSQFTKVADRWLGCVYALGGNTTPWSVPGMNYRAFNLATSLPLTTGVKEPEAAGSIAWILYNAYIETKERKYLEGAYMALDFLTGLDSNPSYELQLPYGTLAAARINAIEGGGYPLQKLLDWCFNRGSLRGWGSIVGTWGGYDVSGLIGEANDAGNDYAFIMNGFQQAAALAPLPKYDKRYARTIAKWILNVTNASRLFYHNALPQELQDSYDWASAYDTAACIPHESMKEVYNSKSPFATGDAINGEWASTNLSLYSGSSVGYLAAVVDTTNIPGILQIDLNKTDFYTENPFPAYLYFNPTGSAQSVQLSLPQGNYNVYDAITEMVIVTNVSVNTAIPVPSGEVRMISLIPAGSVLQSRNGKLYIEESVVDYNYGYDFSGGIYIKALAVEEDTVAYLQKVIAFCEAGNVPDGDLPVYNWYLDGLLLAQTDTNSLAFTVPETEGASILKCVVSLNEESVTDSLSLIIMPFIPEHPALQGIQSENKYEVIGSEVEFTAAVTLADGEQLMYAWTQDGIDFASGENNSVTWTAPYNPGIYTIGVRVTNRYNLSSQAEILVLVKDTTLSHAVPLIYYPFDSDTQNAVADRFHATVTGATRTSDPRGESGQAFRFSAGSNIIYTANEDDLNFSGPLSVSCWVKCESLGSERFIISHGSWQQRYKLSITPEGYFRWTVKTDQGVVDIDNSFVIELNRYYHVTALYTGYSMELYINGEFDTFTEHSGSILSSTYALTIGRMNTDETLYNLLGSIDEVKVWNCEIPAGQIAALPDEWYTPTSTLNIDESNISVYPNPAKDILNISLPGDKAVKSISLFNATGSLVAEYSGTRSDLTSLPVSNLVPGIYLLRVFYSDNTVFNKKVVLK